MIPKIIHQIWIGDKPIPDKFKKYIESWKKFNPDYQYILWDNKKVTKLNSRIIKDILNNKELSNVVKSDFLRYFILKENGGIYVDTDFECLRPFDYFLKYDLFTGFEASEIISNGLIGSKTNNPIFDALLVKSYYNYKKNSVEFCNSNPVNLFGPNLFKSEFIQNDKNIAFEQWYFYPLNYDNTEKDLLGNKPYASHHWQTNNKDHWTQNNKHPMVSVLIPVYNTEKYLKKCIESVLNQTYTNIEMIIVNDGSTDNSEKIIKQYIDKIIYIKQENKGLSGARNTAVKNSKGDWLMPIDSDDWVNENFVEKLIYKVEDYKSIVTPIVHKYHYKEELYLNEFWPDSQTNLKDIFESNMITGPSLFSKELFNKVNGYCEDKLFKEQGCEDWHLWAKMIKENASIVRLNNFNEHLYFYRVGHDSLSNKIKNMDLIKERINEIKNS